LGLLSTGLTLSPLAGGNSGSGNEAEFIWHLCPFLLRMADIHYMGSLKKRRKAKINKHKRRKKLRLNRHKKRTWQK